MRNDRADWEARHAERKGAALGPSSFLCRTLHRLPRGRALEVACGSGRNAGFLARHGFRVEAIDLSHAGLVAARASLAADRSSFSAIQADLETYPLPRMRYQVVVNVRYLQKTLWPGLKHSLADLGMIVFETFLRDQSSIGHPKNPDFLLERGELARAFADFEILDYEEGLFASEDDAAFLARMLARRPKGWNAD
jgi:SAM-dependent methyltransferase